MKFEIISSLYPKAVEGVISGELGLIANIYPEERELIKHAIQKRQGEFAVGRLCAKEGLMKLGIDNFPILKDDKGAPIWPKGVKGSISHAPGCCAVVVARVEEGESLGLDIEKVDRLSEELWPYLFGEEEVNWLRNQGDDGIQTGASILFAAKEAFYKAQYLLTHSWLGFKDVVVQINKTKNEFTVRLLVDLGSWQKGKEFIGRYALFGGYVACGIWIESMF